LGDIKIDSGLAKKMLQDSKYLEEDALAHAYEHSLEVELPILQYFKPQFDIVPIAFLSDDLGALKEAGREIGTTISSCGNRDSIMFVASSDMTHYESEAEAKRKDHEAIKAILALNEDELMEKIRRFKISMCGYAPVIAMLSAVKVLGAKTGELIKYQTSGDVTGDRDSVVGYAGIIIT
jgi:AmmeMemoRadiSam system protein B